MEEPVELTFKDLRQMTDDFSEERIVGEGGFGIVYKGVTKHGADVAVKILRQCGSNPDLDFKQFRDEFYNLMKVKHDNIVQFLGYCYEIEPAHMEYNGVIVPVEEIHGALCFEYLHNGSLKNHLSDESSRHDWPTRYNIIKGICEGLRYIHETESLVHLDLKPDNILLDQDMVPKIADFGLSMIFGEELTRTTECLLGTRGFQPPELIDKGEISKKFDIFSLGVIIIKIVSGPEGYPKCQDIPSQKFIDQVKINWRKRWQTSSNDSKHESTWCSQVETCTKVALLNCLEKDSQKRPDIVKIIDMLNETETDNYKKRQVLQPPENGNKTMCERMIRHDKMELIEEPEVITDVGEDLIVGRDEEVNKIMTSLFESIKSAKMVILPIYGIGGIGKTTFVKLIYNHTNFKYYSHVWVYVSRKFDLKEIGKSIDSQLSGEENQANDQLISKEVIIVLDDLWEDNPVEIEELKDMLYPGDSIKNVIVLVTTRTADIAQKIRRNIEPYQIEPLTDEMCWDIIKEKSGFKDVHDKENENMVDIGKKIAQKCGGVALAAQTLGFMLRSIKHDEWITVKDSDIWNENISKDASLPRHVLASLKLSYAFSMDDFLKKCFTYCAIFPKGHKIVKYDLIYQWISLGFIIPTKILSTLQLCEKYIVRLLGLTFLQHSMSAKTYHAYGEHDTVFTMHDLVHDLATSLLRDQIFDQSKQVDVGESSCCYALLTYCSKPLESCMTSPAGLSALRFLDCWRTELHGAAFEPATSLQALDLSECSIQKLPDSIGQLKQLGYLNAPRIRDQMVPECITKLSNLRYLSLSGSCAIQTLPDSIGEMERLVHLDLSGCVGMEKLPESFGNLKSLEHVDFTNCKNVTGVLQCLAKLTKLQYLNLTNCKNIGHLPRALGSLTELQYLNLSDSSCLSGNEVAEAEFLGSLTKLKYLNLSPKDGRDIINLPEALGSLTELKYFNLASNFHMKKLPASFGNLCNLVHLDLSRCFRLQDVPAALNGLTKLQYLDLSMCSFHDVMVGLQEVLGSLSELRHLNLQWCIAKTLHHPDELNSLLERICTFTNLEYLNLSCNANIYSIPDTLGELRKLHTLDLSYCSSLKSLPARISEIGNLKYLYIRGCMELDRSTLPQYNTGDGESSIFPFQLKYESPNQQEIRKLEDVKSAKEAQTIKLVEKAHITELHLEWTKNADRFVDDAEVLRELEPPHSVSVFWISGYNSASFPSWVMRIGTYLPGLTSVLMWDLPRCNHLPPLGQLPNLRKLGFERMDSIKKIGADLYGGTGAFPRLEEFIISDMECLEEWITAYSSDKDGLNEPAFPCLRNVEIKRCPRLRIKPEPPRSINELRVDSSDEVMLSSFWYRGHFGASACTHLHVECCEVPLNRWNLLRHLPYLTDLTITDCSDLTYSSPDFLRDLTSLWTLTVRGGPKILKLPEGLGDLTSLTELDISNCKGIKALPSSVQKLTSLQTLSCNCMLSLPEWLGDLTSLVKLEIRFCKRIGTLPDTIQQLTCLQSLILRSGKSIESLSEWLGDLTSLISLPEWLGDLTSLIELEIDSCGGINTLPDTIKQLTRLQTLTLKHCKSITSLPETLGDLASLTNLEIIHCMGIRTLPDNIQQLTCLQTLRVIGCKRLASLPGKLGNLNSLEELEIANCRDVNTLPDSIQQLIRLQTLTVHGCGSIFFLPDGLGDVISLKKLHISNCCGIETLPDTIQKLTRLQCLEIDSCPKLVRWCLSEDNKKKLAHVEHRIFSEGLWHYNDDYEDFKSDEESENEDLESDPEEIYDGDFESDEESSENEDLESDPEEI